MISTKSSISKQSRYRNADGIAGSAIVAFAIIMFAFSFEFTGEAAIWPRAVLVLLLVLGIVLVVRAGRDPKPSQRTDGTPQHDDQHNIDGESLSRTVVAAPMAVLLMVIGYAALLEIIGFFPSTVAFLAGILWYQRVRNIVAALGIVLVLNLVIYYLFVFELNVQLPTGILFGEG
ncbi:MAG: hypothetical protein GEU98_06490 [Pseudonocardiaceae bacterium]|nr:hypothetical protein [Pseudonocardiaceae bacterium]